MMPTSLDDMALFVAVAQAQSFSRASDKTGVPKSTLSTRISRLESEMGLRLLNRTTRRIELTEAGKFYLQRAVQIVAEAEQAHCQLTDMLTKPQGTVRLSLPIELAQFWIAPFLPEFLYRYPDIRLDFDVNAHRVDLLSDGFDLAIRAGALPDDSTLIARKLTHITGHLYANEAYLAQYGEPQSPMDLANHQCIGFSAGLATAWRLIHTDGMEKTIEITGNLISNHFGMNMRLAELGLGITVLPDLSAPECSPHHTLRRVLGEWHTPDVPIYAITSTRLLPAKVQVLIDFLVEKLRD